MKLTPFGFVNRSEEFVKDALSLPPIGGGKWTTRRVANLMDHSSSLHVSLTPSEGVEKTTMILNTRSTGGARDGGIQGWAEYPGTGEREAFIIKQTEADGAMQEIFDIVEKTLSRVIEWDKAALPARPESAPRAFEPLIPEVKKSEGASAGLDPKVGNAVFSPDSLEVPPEPVVEETPSEPAVEPDDQEAKKPAKGKKAKA